MSPEADAVDTAGGGLSAPCLFYLFADRVLPREGHWNHAMGDIAVPVPKTNTLVSLGALERLLLAVGLWSLADAGVIELAPEEGRGRFRIALKAPRPSRPGLEGTLLSGLPDEGSTDLWDLVMGTWVQDGPMVLNGIVVEVQREAMDALVIKRPDLPHLIPGFLGHHTFPRVDVNGPQLYRQRRAFAVVSGAWAKACASSPQWDELVKRAGRILYCARPAFLTTGVPLQPGRA